MEIVNKIESYFKAWEFFLFRPSWLFKLSNNYRKHCESVYEFQNPFFFAYLCRKNLFEVSETIISERKKIRSQAGFTSESKKQKLFLDALLDAQENSARNSAGNSSEEISHDEVRQCVLEMLLAGTDTSSVTMFYTIILLCEHEEIQNKVLEEISISSSSPSSSSSSSPHSPTPSPTPSPSPLLDGVIKECLRLKPVGPVIMRKALKDDIIPSGIP